MGMVAGIVGGVIGAVGHIRAGNDAKQAAIDQEAAIRSEARQHAIIIRRSAREARGQARADLAASGVVLDEGSPLTVDRTIIYRSELDALNVLASGEAAARSVHKSGNAAVNASYFNAAGSILGGASSFGGGGKPGTTTGNISASSSYSVRGRI